MSNHLKGHSSLASMVLSHIGVWRKLVVMEKMQIALDDERDKDDMHFIEHELEALENIEAACLAEIRSTVQSSATGG